MATTVNDSKLTTTTSDRIILNGVTYGGQTSSEINNCDEVYNRIMTIPAFAVDGQGAMTQDFVSIVSATPLPNSAGDVEFAKFVYARITNLDDRYPIAIRVADNVDPRQATMVYVVQIPAGTSYIVHSAGFFADDQNINAQQVYGRSASNNRVLAISAVASNEENTGDGCDIEVFVVTK
ncbi:MAG: hypothetical protein GOVbin5978_19 [Prokaryotic dsDNA virus sp.]|nr:MAG: hypothetical protein GOVbin5978_19 [Prokaryotic dsDNA virus sp.]|tara:strand:- start:26128 stop:26664 length:537 start_codon:yes stop_codon:yes gene_type:complete